MRPRLKGRGKEPRLLPLPVVVAFQFYIKSSAREPFVIRVSLPFLPGGFSAFHPLSWVSWVNLQHNSGATLLLEDLQALLGYLNFTVLPLQSYGSSSYLLSPSLLRYE